MTNPMSHKYHSSTAKLWVHASSLHHCWTSGKAVWLHGLQMSDKSTQTTDLQDCMHSGLLTFIRSRGWVNTAAPAPAKPPRYHRCFFTSLFSDMSTSFVHARVADKAILCTRHLTTQGFLRFQSGSKVTR